MEGFDHREAHYSWEWDVKSVDTVVAQRAHFLSDDHGVVARLLPRYLDCCPLDLLAGLPHSVIHSDINDTNVLIKGNDVLGLLDFADCIWSPTIFELGLCAAYWTLQESDLFEPFGALIRGYQEGMGRLLTTSEVKVIYGAALGRILTSVVCGLESAAREPDNAYLPCA